MKSDAGSWDVIQRFADCADFDDCRLYLRGPFEYSQILVNDFSPNDSSTVTNQNTKDNSMNVLVID